MSELLKRILTFGLLGAALVAGAILFYNKDATPTLSGEITEVRTLAMDEGSSVAIVNFTGTNASNRLMIIHQRELAITDQDGIVHTGLPIQISDVRNLFQYFPILGEMKDEPLPPRTELESGKELRGMVAARFNLPKNTLDSRQALVLRVYDAAKKMTAIEEVR